MIEKGGNKSKRVKMKKKELSKYSKSNEWKTICYVGFRTFRYRNGFLVCTFCLQKYHRRHSSATAEIQYISQILKKCYISSLFFFSSIIKDDITIDRTKRVLGYATFVDVS